MHLPFTREYTLAAGQVHSLVWDGDELVDWASGGRRFALDGSQTPAAYAYDGAFDAAIVSPSGKFVALVAQTGTAGVLLRNGEVIRPLTRDPYQAEAYPYPLTFARLADGREMLVHCPESYCQLEIEDIVTGTRIASAKPRAPQDFFHTGLCVSPGGRWLISVGWVWHPVGVTGGFDLVAASLDSSILDAESFQPPGRWEMGSAAFLDAETLIVGSHEEFFGDEGDPLEDTPGKYALGLWRLGERAYAITRPLPHPVGAILPLSRNFVITFYEHPRLYDLRSGELVYAWRHINSGLRSHPITWDNLPPPTAVQPERGRFAVASKTAVHVVEIDLTTLPP